LFKLSITSVADWWSPPKRQRRPGLGRPRLASLCG